MKLTDKQTKQKNSIKKKIKHVIDIDNNRAWFIRNKFLLNILSVIYYKIYRLPYWIGGWKIMYWITSHTPADENERK